MIRNDLTEHELKSHLLEVGCTLANLGKTSIEVIATNGAVIYAYIEVRK
jgi:hypothetical protein